MALETLKGIDSIGGYDVVVMDELREKYPEKFEPGGQMNWGWFESTIRPNNFIYVRHDKNSLSFTIQDGPIKENGINGCQVDTLIHAALIMIKELDKKFPCKENKKASFCLVDSLFWLEERKKDREKRGVEGTSKA